MQPSRKSLSSFLAIVAALLLALTLAACTPAASRLDLAAARIDHRGGAELLAIECDWKPSAEMLDALDHGIPLTLSLTLSRQQRGLFGWRTLASEQHRLELRYFPLTRNYQLRDLQRDNVRSFGVRAAALAAFSRLELPLQQPGLRAADGERQHLRIDFDGAALPGALRLPALIAAAWRQDSVETTWPGTPAA